MINYAQQTAKQNEKDTKELEKFVPKIPKLNGFVGKWERGSPLPTYIFENTDTQVKFLFMGGGSGSTTFLVEGKGWLTFDRRGVESSFYWKPFDYKGAPKVDIKEVLNEQLVRIADRREYYTSAVTIPQVGSSIAPDKLPKLREQLKKQTYIRFSPSGFGTGYTVSTKRLRFGKPADMELTKFFGIGPLYIETFDAD